MHGQTMDNLFWLSLFIYKAKLYQAKRKTFFLILQVFHNLNSKGFCLLAPLLNHKGFFELAHQRVHILFLLYSTIILISISTLSRAKFCFIIHHIGTGHELYFHFIWSTCHKKESFPFTRRLFNSTGF